MAYEAVDRVLDSISIVAAFFYPLSAVTSSMRLNASLRS
jgi:hypothetical protein